MNFQNMAREGVREPAAIMAKGNREAHLASIRFQHPEFIPCDIGFYIGAAYKYRELIPDFYRRHPWIHNPGNMQIPDRLLAGAEYVDEWGCRWRTLEDGVEGQVIEHPLDDWSALDSFQPPAIHLDLPKLAKDYEETRRNGVIFTMGGGGNFFERMHYLRGYENLLIDMTDDSPELLVLIDKLVQHKLETLQAYIELGADVMFFFDDLGIQDRLMMSPAAFRKYLKPAYAQFFGVGVKHGIVNMMHTDGIIVEIIGDLLDCGLHSVNLQGDLIGIDYLAAEWKGRIHMSWNLDMQYVLPYGTPSEVDDYIGRIVEKMWLPEGGFDLSASIMPDVPWENIESLANAMEKWCFCQG